MRVDDLRKKLESCVSKMRRGEKHWLVRPDAPAAIYVPEIPAPSTISIRRAIYAAFVGDIPENREVVPRCQHKYCINPEHVTLRKSKKPARPLSFSMLPTEESEPSNDLAKLPKGLTLDAFAMIRHSVSSHRREALVHGIDVKEVVRVRSGLYDAAARAETKRLKSLGRGQEKGPVDRSSEASFQQELADFLQQTKE
jgi:hypothetical protein